MAKQSSGFGKRQKRTAPREIGPSSAAPRPVERGTRGGRFRWYGTGRRFANWSAGTPGGPAREA